MTMLFEAQTYLCKYQFVALLRKADMHKMGCLTKKSLRQNKQKHCHCEPVTDIYFRGNLHL